MINRPRCRDWTPLATQQLRLRNLIQITGHNVVADANTSIYFTLHLTLMSAPFFTSERLESFRNAIWSEINCQSIHKSAAQAVVVRVWQTNRRRATALNVIDGQQPAATINGQATAATAAATTAEASGERQRALSNGADDKDKVLFVWAVHFSGLVPITKRTDVKLVKNALVFYIHGGFFTSANYLRGECIPKQYNHFFQPLLQSSPARGAAAASAAAIPNRICDKSNSTKTSNRSSASYAASERASDSFATSPKWSSKSAYDAPSIHAGDYLLSSEAAEDDGQTSADGCDCNDDEQNVLKVRYLDKVFFRWEIRRSYNVTKLLALQEKQRSYRRETLNANELMEKICMKSASCLNLQLIANKGMLYRPRANPSLGRTLNRLLQTHTEQLKPEDLLRAQALRRQIETAKFRCRLLTMERDRYKVIVRKLNDTCAKLSDDNIEQESDIMNDVRELSRSRDMAIEQKGMHANKQQIYERVHKSLVERQYQLLGELRKVYTIETIDSNGLYEINGHCLPNSDLLCLYYGAMSSNTTQAAASLSIAMGCVAHLVLLCSSILNIPLRNRIIYQGSSSKIRDDKTDLAEHEREFPLFCRTIPPSQTFQYAAFLLNQNISQLKYTLNVHSPRENSRATLLNLLAILSVGEYHAQRQAYVPPESKAASISMLDIDAIDAPISSVSNTSIDMLIAAPDKKTYSASVENIDAVGRPKIGQCKSRGSYSDEQLAMNIEAMTLDKRPVDKRTLIQQRPNFGSEPILPGGPH